jgi:hypothetical protein
MILEQDHSDIPLGVECAWPGTIDSPRAMPGEPRQRRLAEAWRRLVVALQANRRSNWAR